MAIKKTKCTHRFIRVCEYIWVLSVYPCDLCVLVDWLVRFTISQ